MVTNILTKDGFLTNEVILDLRKQIVLNSLYLDDYENDYGFNTDQVCTFFDGFLSFIGEMMAEDGISDKDFFERLPDYDTKENLIAWYDCFNENPFDIDCLSELDKTM